MWHNLSNNLLPAFVHILLSENLNLALKCKKSNFAKLAFLVNLSPHNKYQTFHSFSFVFIPYHQFKTPVFAPGAAGPFAGAEVPVTIGVVSPAFVP